MPKAHSNFDTTKQLTDKAAVDRGRRLCRTSSSLPFDLEVSKSDQSSQSLRLNVDIDRSGDWVVSMDVLRLHGPSVLAVDGSPHMLITYVLRHSSSALRWREGTGDISRLEPGSVLINQGRRNSLTEIAPWVTDQQCECIRIVFRSGFITDLPEQYEAYDFPFCNSPEACVRVIFGQYLNGVLRASPVPNLSMFDIDIAPCSQLQLPLFRDQLGVAILTSGSIETRGMRVNPWHLVAFEGCEPFATLTTQIGASVLWLGIPLGTGPVAPPAATIGLL